MQRAAWPVWWIKGAVVEVSGGSARRKLYYLTERLYNIYYLMRRARGPAPLIDALIRFMEAFYSTDKLREFGARMAREALGFDGGALAIYRMAFERLVGLPSLEAHREELLSLAAPAFAYAPSEFSAVSPSHCQQRGSYWGKRWRSRKAVGCRTPWRPGTRSSGGSGKAISAGGPRTGFAGARQQGKGVGRVGKSGRSTGRAGRRGAAFWNRTTGKATLWQWRRRSPARAEC